MGLAIKDYFYTGHNKPLCIKSSMYEDDEMPVQNLFRTEADMPWIEQQALKLCNGRILDVGAGAGCHSMVLQQKGHEVISIDISPNSVDVMRQRGISEAYCADFYTDEFGCNFNTILMLMNGIGIAGSLRHLPNLLKRCQELMTKDGCILADSSDLRYIYEDENGLFDWDKEDGYYGEVDFQMQYGSCKGPTFNWLYVDFETLSQIAQNVGMQAKKICTGNHYEYLARLRMV